MFKEKALNSLNLKSAEKPTYDTISGTYVFLKKLDPDTDLDKFYIAIHETDIAKEVWKFGTRGPFPNPEALKDAYKRAVLSDDRRYYCIMDKSTNTPIGTIALVEINTEDASVEIGNVMICKKYQKTEANTESVFLLARYCFEELNFRRITWKCDNKNIASKKVALRLGFEFEGISRNHMIVKGRNRDTAWFGLIVERWPMLARNYIRWLKQSDSSKRDSLAKMNSAVKSYSFIIDGSCREEESIADKFLSS